MLAKEQVKMLKGLGIFMMVIRFSILVKKWELLYIYF